MRNNMKYEKACITQITQKSTDTFLPILAKSA